MLHIDWPAPFYYFFMALDIIVVAFLTYKALIYIFHSWTLTIVKGVLIIAMVFLTAHILKLKTLLWLFEHFLAFLPLGLMIIFQQEIRRFLSHIGTPGLFNRSKEKEKKELSESLEKIFSALALLSKRKIGALIVLEQEVDHKIIKEKAIALNSEISEQLLVSIFIPTTPLHDGGVIINGKKILVARAFFPITEKSTASYLGSRHRAAIGLSERSDAFVLICSEETGFISMAYQGKIYYNIGLETLREKLLNMVGYENEIQK